MRLLLDTHTFLFSVSQINYGSLSLIASTQPREGTSAAGRK